MQGKITDWNRAVKAMAALRGITYEDMARDLGITRQYLSALINGRMRSEPMERRISDYLGIPYADFTAHLEFKPKDK